MPSWSDNVDALRRHEWVRTEPLVDEHEATPRPGQFHTSRTMPPRHVDEGVAPRVVVANEGEVLDIALAVQTPVNDRADGDGIGPEEPPGQVDRVEHVHQDATAGLRGGMPPPGRVGGGAGAVLDAEEVERDHLNLADLTAVKDLLDGPVDRHEDVIVDRGQGDSVAIRHLDHRVRFGWTEGEGLLAQQVLARLGRRDGDRGPNPLWRGHHHRVDVRTGDHLPPVQRAVRLRQPGRHPSDLEPVRRRVGEGPNLDAGDRRERR